jgi:RNase P subunit RPR2
VKQITTDIHLPPVMKRKICVNCTHYDSAFERAPVRQGRCRQTGNKVRKVKVGCEYFAYLFRDVTKKMRDGENTNEEGVD